MPRTHEEFGEALEESRGPVFAVAEWLHRQEYDIFIPKIVLKPKYAKAIDYVDDGDIHMTKDGVTYKVNVKGHPNLNFTGETWPYKNVFVASTRFVDLKGDDMNYYMSLSADGKCICVINTKRTKHAWYVVSYYDKRSRKQEEVYACPVELVKFFAVEEDE